MLLIFNKSFMTNLRANWILLLHCNLILNSQFSDFVILREKFISLRPLAQYAWNLVEVFIYESSNFYINFISFGLHWISQNNFLPKLLWSESAMLKLTEFNSKLIFFLTNLHVNCTETSIRYVCHAHNVLGQFISVWTSKSMLEGSQFRFSNFWTDLIFHNSSLLLVQSWGGFGWEYSQDAISIQSSYQYLSSCEFF